MAKEDNQKSEGGAKTKVRRLKQSTYTWKATFKELTSVIEDKVFNFGKQKHAIEFVNDCEEISKIIAINYKHGRPKMYTAIKNMEKSMITIPESP